MSHRSALAVIALLGACSSPPATPTSPNPVQPQTQDAVHEDGPVVLGTRTVRGVQLTLEARKRTWWLGENIVLHYVAKNVGDTPTSISWGGDYRGGSRAERIKVTGTDPSGAPLTDPHPKSMNFGGLGGDPELAPGEEFAFVVPVGRYRRFEVAGVHRVAVAHDLGWSADTEPLSDDDERWVEGALEIRVPTVEKARAIVANMQAIAPQDDRTVGERSVPYADFSALGYPIYLPLLASIVETEPRAMEGLAYIATVDATAEVLGADVRALAESLLGASDPERVMRGAQLLAAVAEPQDVDRVTRALDRSLKATKAAPIPYPEPRTAVSELIATAEALLGQGVSSKLAPSTPGEIAWYLLEHGGERARPAGYGSLAATWLQHDIPQLGVLVLRRTKLPFELMLQQLLFVIDSTGYGTSGVPHASEGARLKKVWTAWLAKHGRAVRAGERFALGHRALSADLLPPGFALNNAAGERWPVP